MTEHEAQAELMILRGLADSGNDLALVRERIDRLYFEVCGKHLRDCKCRNVEKDALLEIYSKLMYHKKTNTNMAQAKLVNGVVIQWGGTHYTNANLTDKVAKAFLEAFPMRKDWFAQLPSKEEAKVTEKVAEDSPKEVIVADKPSAPKTKKTAKKRK